MVITKEMIKNGTRKRFNHQNYMMIPYKGREKEQIMMLKKQCNRKNLPTQMYHQTVKQLKERILKRKFELIHHKYRQGIINPNNKKLVIKPNYAPIKGTILKHKHICIMYYGEQYHFKQDIVLRLQK